MENIGILEKIREKRKEEARLRSLANLKNSKVVDASNLTHRDKPTDSNRLDEKMAGMAGMSVNTYKAARVIYNEGTEETNIRQRGVGNTNAIKLGRCIKELERIYGIRDGSAGKRSLDGNNFRPKSQADIAEELGISQRQLSNYKKLTELIPEVQELVETGYVSPTIATAIARLEKV